MLPESRQRSFSIVIEMRNSSYQNKNIRVSEHLWGPVGYTDIAALDMKCLVEEKWLVDYVWFSHRKFSEAPREETKDTSTYLQSLNYQKA